MKRLLLLTILTGCAATEPDPTCGGNWGSLRIGMGEETMLRCSFRGYHPYKSAEIVDADGVFRQYKGTLHPDRIYVRDGVVVSWTD